MAKYIRISDKQYPFTERDIKALFPNTSFPTPFRATGFEVVFPVPKPDCTSLQIAIEGEPQISSKGHWEQTWEIVDKFHDYTDDEGVFHSKEAQETAFLAQELANAKQAKQTANKEACKSHILAKYPIEIQLSMNAGIYTPAEFEAYQAFVVACIAEENRVFDLLEAATTIEELNQVEEPIWPEV